MTEQDSLRVKAMEQDIKTKAQQDVLMIKGMEKDVEAKTLRVKDAEQELIAKAGQNALHLKAAEQELIAKAGQNALHLKAAEQAILASEEQRVRAQRLRTVAGVAASSVALALIADHVWNGTKAVLSWRLRRRIRSNAGNLKLSSFAAPLPLHLFPKVKIDLGHELPVLLLGPTGCGKSTLLSHIIQQRPQSVTPLIRFRLATTAGAVTADPVASGRAIQESNSGGDLLPIAEQLYMQIGFPTRPPLCQWMFPLVSKISAGGVQLKMRDHLVQTRMAYALTLYFQACESVCDERNGDPVVLLLDEVQDLVRTDRLVAAGGQYVFDTLCTLIIISAIERKKMRVILCGSSAFLWHWVSRNALGVRSMLCFVPDPVEDDVRIQLQRCGYSADESNHIIAVVGCRLRLLQVFLSAPTPLPADRRPVAAALDVLVSRSVGSIERCLMRAWAVDSTGNTCTAVIKALDKLVFPGASRKGKSELASEDSPRVLPVEDASAPIVRLSDFPVAGQVPEVLAQVFYLHVHGTMTIQNRSVHVAWETKRQEILSSVLPVH